MVGLGVIGAGVMGADHARIIAQSTAGARLVAIADADQARSRAIAAATGAMRVFDNPRALIADPSVDAVVIASPDQTHADFALACVAAGKPVLCEKPLAPTTAECRTVIEAEMASGRRLVQVGFMRRFDPAYVAMKAAFDGGSLGRPFMLHCVHRNASAPPSFTSGMAITNSCVHEIDILRFILSTEVSAVRVLQPAASVGGRGDDPLLVAFETEAGALVDVELFLNCGYGYDIKGELVCEKGTVSLTPPQLIETRTLGAASFPFAADWRPRFADAYRLQMQAFVEFVRTGVPNGASAFDGYVATAVAEAGLSALASGDRAIVTLDARPPFYS